jgi:hypothetical protein
MVSRMNPVTDPNIIAQLNGSQGLKPVSDPNVLAQLNGEQPQQAALPGMNYVPPGIKDILSGLATGGQNINQFLTNDVAKPVVGMFSPNLASKINAPAPINFDQMFGMNNPDMIDKLVKGAAQYSPAMLTGGASFPSQIAAGAAYNATQMPNHPLSGAVIGGGLAAIPGAVGAGAKLLDAVRPQKYAEQLMSNLSGGQTLEQNQQALAQAIKNGYQQATSKGKDLYNKVFNKPIQNDVVLYHGASSNADDILNNGLNAKKYSQDYPVLTNDPNAAIAYSARHLGDDEGGDLFKITIPGNQVDNYLHPENSNWITNSLKPRGFESSSLYGIKQPIPSQFIQRTQDSDLLQSNSLPINTLGNSAIYNRKDPIYGVSQQGNYEGLGKNVFNNFSGDVKDMHQNFMQNPTLNNAQQLQSQLGSEIGSLQKAIKSGNADVSDKNALSAYQKARGSLQADMNTYLGSQGIDPLSDYLSATKNWQQTVTPYLSKPALAKVATGENTNPANVYNLFKNPGSKTTQVANDLGDDAARQVLYSYLGKTQNNLTPETLANAIGSLDKQGLGSYVTPSLQQQFNNLSGKIAARNMATFGLGPRLSTAYRALQQSTPLSQVGSDVAHGIGAAYPYLDQALIANMLNGGNQQ